MKAINFIAAVLCFLLAVAMCVAQTALTRNVIVFAALALISAIMGCLVKFAWSDLKDNSHE